MARSRSIDAAGLLGGSLLAGYPAVALSESDSPLTRFVSSDAKKFQAELDRAVADGYHPPVNRRRSESARAARGARPWPQRRRWCHR